MQKIHIKEKLSPAIGGIEKLLGQARDSFIRTRVHCFYWLQKRYAFSPTKGWVLPPSGLKSATALVAKRFIKFCILELLLLTLQFHRTPLVRS